MAPCPCGFFSKKLLISVKRLPKAEHFHKAVLELLLYYHRRFGVQFPPLNSPLLLFRYIKRLTLPSMNELISPYLDQTSFANISNSRSIFRRQGVAETSWIPIQFPGNYCRQETTTSSAWIANDGSHYHFYQASFPIWWREETPRDSQRTGHSGYGLAALGTGPTTLRSTRDGQWENWEGQWDLS